MAYDEKFAQRIRVALHTTRNITERKMFGGIAFMLNGKMFCGIATKALMLRLGPEGATAALKRAHVRPMDFTGRPMKGYVYVDQPGLKGAALAAWIKKATTFVKTL